MTLCMPERQGTCSRPLESDKAVHPKALRIEPTRLYGERKYLRDDIQKLGTGSLIYKCINICILKHPIHRRIK